MFAFGSSFIFILKCFVCCWKAFCSNLSFCSNRPGELVQHYAHTLFAEIETISTQSLSQFEFLILFIDTYIYPTVKFTMHSSSDLHQYTFHFCSSLFDFIFYFFCHLSFVIRHIAKMSAFNQNMYVYLMS